jgi:hypothetical protein
MAARPPAQGRYGGEHVALLTGLLSAAILLAVGLQLAPAIGPAWLVFVAAALVDVMMAVVLYKRIRLNRLQCPHCGTLRRFTPDGLKCADCDR